LFSQTVGSIHRPHHILVHVAAALDTLREANQKYFGTQSTFRNVS
jgi:hypothetical protein